MTQRGLRLLIAAPGILLLVPEPCSAQERPVVCASCHQSEAGDLEQSVHSGLKCQECHQGEGSYDVSPQELQRYTQPASPGRPRPAFDHGPNFAGKPERREIPERCGGCHADVERMNPYGLRTDQLARYWTSGHGKTLRSKGDERVAVCVDCHGAHDVLAAHEPTSRTNPVNVSGTCATCHADQSLMQDYDLPVGVVDEYRQSVHGRLLLEQHDSGAPQCATCHGNHSAMPPGFATVGAVCGKCHTAAAQHFAQSIHASPELADYFSGCVQCHGGGEGRHHHLIERITNPAGLMIQRYEHLLTTEPKPTLEQVREAIHPNPKQVISRVLPTCTDCHDELEEDESLQKLFQLLDSIAEAERKYVETGRRLDQVGRGVLLVDRQRFMFQDAKTHLIELAPLQHTLDNEKVAEKVTELNEVCEAVNAALGELERGLRWRYRALIPIWAFAVVFAAALYGKYKWLKKKYVTPSPATREE